MGNEVIFLGLFLYALGAFTGHFLIGMRTESKFKEASMKMGGKLNQAYGMTDADGNINLPEPMASIMAEYWTATS